MNVRTILPTLGHLFSGVLLSSRRPCNIAAFHVGRCGSRVLGDLLKQHSNVVWDGELFSPGRLDGIASRWPWLTRNPFNILRLRMTMAGRRCYGFETQPTQVERLKLDLDTYVDRLQQLGFGHFILIERKNHLHRILSILRGHQSDQWHRIGDKSGSVGPPARSHGPPSADRVHLDVDRLILNWGTDIEPRPLIEHLERTENTVSQLRDVLSRRRLLCLTYEDDIKTQPEQAYRRICEFVGIEAQPVEVRFQKTNPHPLPDLIDNFSEVESKLRGTRFEWMLDG